MSAMNKTDPTGGKNMEARYAFRQQMSCREP